MIQAICRRLLTAHGRVKSPSNPCETSEQRSGTGIGYGTSTLTVSRHYYPHQCSTFILSYHQTYIFRANFKDV
jgi:hypothetical protein